MEEGRNIQIEETEIVRARVCVPTKLGQRLCNASPLRNKKQRAEEQEEMDK
jgi:hypothetical protein